MGFTNDVDVGNKIKQYITYVRLHTAINVRAWLTVEAIDSSSVASSQQYNHVKM